MICFLLVKSCGRLSGERPEIEMKPSVWLKPAGYAMQLVAGGGFVVVTIQRIVLGLPHDPASIAFDIANIGFCLSGVLVVAIAKWLRELEGRVKKLEERSATPP
jgi:hypothetical protein